MFRTAKATFQTPVLALLGSVAFATGAFAQSVGEPGREADSPNPLKNVYFGEQHIHTTNSPDAFVIGTRGSWEDAYNWAMGNEITLSTSGEKIQKQTPYDFIGITDHAEYFGVMPSLIDPDSELSKTELGQKMQDPNADPAAPDSAINQILASLITGVPMAEFVSPELAVSNWARYVETADKFYKPGEFTTLYAWEWTSIPNGRNMHRNVFFRDKAPEAPFTAFDSIYPEDLWTYQEIHRGRGRDSIAIPHNGNVSDGWMYSENTFLGGPMDARHARRQQANEPLTEIIQTKGSSDTHPALSPNDEFANFELFPNMINVGQPSQIQNGYIRQGLARGMALEEKLGVNPFKYGIVSGADSHSAYSPNEEDNFHGSHGLLDDTPEKRLNPTPNASGDVAAVVGSAGATAVWAEENTREAIFDAMKRRETYGTSGPLIRLRFFGGWDYPEDLVESDGFVQAAYDGGVPMGGDLAPLDDIDSGKAPTFAVWALKDPNSGNLDRVQIIKSFVNKWSRPDEKIYDVIWSDQDTRQIDETTGKLPPVGNTVDLTTATYTNDIGATQLRAVWTDPDFEPGQQALYYVRVLEIPTPRWSTYDSVRNNLPLLEEVPATIQERAWSSPIWYTPPREVLIERRLQEVTGKRWGVSTYQE
jgi:hypothetical protein